MANGFTIEKIRNNLRGFEKRDEPLFSLLDTYNAYQKLLHIQTTQLGENVFFKHEQFYINKRQVKKRIFYEDTKDTKDTKDTNDMDKETIDVEDYFIYVHKGKNNLSLNHDYGTINVNFNVQLYIPIQPHEIMIMMENVGLDKKFVYRLFLKNVVGQLKASDTYILTVAKLQELRRINIASAIYTLRLKVDVGDVKDVEDEVVKVGKVVKDVEDGEDGEVDDGEISTAVAIYMLEQQSIDTVKENEQNKRETLTETEQTELEVVDEAAREGEREGEREAAERKVDDGEISTAVAVYMLEQQSIDDVRERDTPKATAMGVEARVVEASSLSTTSNREKFIVALHEAFYDINKHWMDLTSKTMIELITGSSHKIKNIVALKRKSMEIMIQIHDKKILIYNMITNLRKMEDDILANFKIGDFVTKGISNLNNENYKNLFGEENVDKYNKELKMDILYLIFFFMDPDGNNGYTIRNDYRDLETNWKSLIK